MTEVIDLQREREERTPHLSGEARCLACKHKWIAVAPVGTLWLECPSCTLTRGRYSNQVENEGLHWTCKCENDLFYVTVSAIYCPNCGLEQVMP